MKIVQCSASFTRPNDTTAYASGDLVANSTTAGSVVPLTLAVPEGKRLKIYRIGIGKTSTTVANASFRVHLFKDSPTVANGDNGAISASVSGWLGSFDVDGTAPAMTGGSQAYSAPPASPTLVFLDNDCLVYALVEARAAYTPTANEVITVSLTGEAYV